MPPGDANVSCALFDDSGQGDGSSSLRVIMTRDIAASYSYIHLRNRSSAPAVAPHSLRHAAATAPPIIVMKRAGCACDSCCAASALQLPPGAWSATVHPLALLAAVVPHTMTLQRSEGVAVVRGSGVENGDDDIDFLVPPIALVVEESLVTVLLLLLLPPPPLLMLLPDQLTALFHSLLLIPPVSGRRWRLEREVRSHQLCRRRRHTRVRRRVFCACSCCRHPHHLAPHRCRFTPQLPKSRSAPVESER